MLLLDQAGDIRCLRRSGALAVAADAQSQVPAILRIYPEQYYPGHFMMRVSRCSG
jgi:hypothetical protein